MKRSIFIAFIILAAVVGWIGSGQFTNNVVAQGFLVQKKI